MLFSLRVISETSAPQELRLEAASAAEARLQAERQGLSVLHVSVVSKHFGLQKSQFPLMLFCQEFSVLLEAGLSMPEVLEALMQKETTAVHQSRLASVLAGIKEGQALSQAMAAQPTVFPSLLVATISAAETTGNLPDALARYTQYSENVDLLKKRIASASLYPAIVVSFGLIVLVFLMIYVIPKFSKIYETQVKHISGSTKLILAVGNFSSQYGLYLVVALLSIVVLSIWAMSQAAIRAKCFHWLCGLPYVGDKVRLYHLSRFYRTFAMLLKSGITVSAALAMVSQMLGSGLQSHLIKAKRLIAEGKGFTDAFEASELTTPVAARLFRVGEQSGTLEHMMERAASFHEDQMVRWVDKFTKIFEPTLMAVIGLLIGGLVLMMYLPIFELASGIE